MFPFTREQFLQYNAGQRDSLDLDTQRSIHENFSAAFRTFDPMMVKARALLDKFDALEQGGLAPVHIIRVLPIDLKHPQPDTYLSRDVILAVLRSLAAGQAVDPRILACINEQKLVSIPGFNQQRLNSQVGNRRNPCPAHCTDKAPRLSTPFNKDAMGIFVMQNPYNPDMPLRLRRFPFKPYQEYVKDGTHEAAIAAAYNAPDPELDGVELDAPRPVLHKHLHDELWSDTKILAFSTGCDCGMANRLFVLDPETQKMILKTF